MKALDLLKLKSVLYILLLAGSTFAQDLSSDAAKADLNFLKSSILEYQPGIQNSAPKFEKSADKVISEIGQDSLSYLDFFREASRLCVMAGEGHYSLGNWDDTIHRGIPNNSIPYFPANVKVINHRLYVEEDYSSEQQMIAGREITRINGKSAASILQELYFCIPSDGAIITNIVDELDYSFPYKYYFFVDQSAYFGVTLKDGEGKEETVSIKALKQNEQRENFKKYVLPNRVTVNDKNPVYSLQINKEYSTLTLRSFNNTKLDVHQIKPKKFFKAIFDTIRQNEVENLVIDLRGNPGGLFLMAQEIMPYLMTKNPDVPFQRKSTSWKGKERKYKFKKRSKNAFEGQLYVLIDGGTFSSASTLARYLKEYSNAVLIGEESGSRYESFAAGSKQYVQLPNSGIEIGIPRYLIEFGPGRKQQTSNRGVLPDHTVECTISQVLEGHDVYLEKVEALILNEK